LSGSVVDPNDLAALQAQAITNYAPHAAGIPGQTLPGGQSAIPNKLLHVPKLITSDYRPPAPLSPFEHAQRMVAFAEGANKLADKDSLTRKIYDWGAEKVSAGLKPTKTESTGGGGVDDIEGGDAIAAPKIMEDMFKRGGRAGFALGSSIPYEESEGYIPKDVYQPQQPQKLPTNQDELKAAAQKATSGSGGLGDAVKAAGMANSAYKLGSKLAPGAMEAVKGGLSSALGPLGTAAGEAATGLGSAITSAIPEGLAAAGSTLMEAAPYLLAFLSDERAKHDKQKVGELYDGQPVYRFKYNGDDRTQIGLMAQNVQRGHPEAVSSHGGLKMVDYARATEDAANKGHYYSGGLVPQRASHAEGDDVKPINRADDYAIRTIMSEAAKKDNNYVDPNEPLGIGAVIANRAAAKGLSPDQVVLEKSQFEPWSLSPNDPNHPLRHDPNSDLYKTTRDLWMKAKGGEDPTGGAMNFYGPKAQAALAAQKGDRAAVPSWAVDKDYSDIGGTRFVRGVDNASAYAGQQPSVKTALINKGLGQALVDTTGGDGDSEPAKKTGTFPIRPPADVKGKEQDWSDFLTSRQFIIPALVGLGTMGSTPTRNFGTGLSAGLLAAAQAYQPTETSAIEQDKKRAEAQEKDVEVKIKQAQLYQRRFVQGYGWEVLDLTKPYSGYVPITDAKGNLLPGIDPEFGKAIPVEKGSPSGPDVKPQQTTTQAQPSTVETKISEVEAPKVEGVDSTVGWAATTAAPKNYRPENQYEIMNVPEQAAAMRKLGSETTAEQSKKASSAQDQLTQLKTMEAEFEAIPKSGFTSLGAYGQEKSAIARKINDLLGVIGAEPMFDPSVQANIEQIHKGSTRLGYATSSAINSREPGYIITGAIRANPNIENTPEGFKRLVNALEQEAQIQIDKDKFLKNYFARFGHIDEAATDMFYKLNPPEKYIARAVAKTVDPVWIQNLREHSPDTREDKNGPTLRELIDKQYGKGTTNILMGGGPRG
jgi:hypothetical protein